MDKAAIFLGVFGEGNSTERTFKLIETLYSCFYLTYVVRSKSFRPDQLFKVTEIKQIFYFSK